MIGQKKSTAWVGWIFFASVLMMLAGGLNIIAGLTGIFNGNFYAAVDGQLVVFNYATWGWIHLILGLGVLLAGVGLMVGYMWARIVAVVLVVLSIFGNVAFLPVYPWWSAIALVVDGLVLYAIAVHGDEVS